MDIPRLDIPDHTPQVVDGNAFMLAYLRNSTNGLLVRDIMSQVRAAKHPVVFVFDGAGGNDRRRKMLPCYKSKRTSPGEDLFASIRLMRECLKYLPTVQVQVPGWEADDVVATIARQRADKGQRIRVVTIDRDLAQLAAHACIDVTAGYPNIHPHQIRIYKATVGDPSDNIPGIPRFGDVGFSKLNEHLLEKMLIAGTFDESVELGLGEAHRQWVRDNWNQLLIMWEVVGLMYVPEEEIRDHITVGSLNPTALEAKLREFML